MDPLSALSVAASAVQFVDFSSRLVAGSLELHNSATGQLVEHTDLEHVTKNLDKLTTDLYHSLSLDKLTENDQRLHEVCRKCHGTAVELSKALDKLKAQRGSKWESVAKALRSIWSREKIETLRGRLDKHRQELILLILVMLRPVCTAYRRNKCTIS